MNTLRFILLTLFWGGSFIAIEQSLHVFPPMIAASVRMGLASLLMGLAAVLTQSKGFSNKKEFVLYVLSGSIALGIPWICLFWGEQYVAPAVASMINSGVPIFVAVWGISFFRSDQPKAQEWVGVSLGFVGIFFIFSKPLLQTQNVGELKGLLAILCMAIFYGLGTNLIKRLGASMGPKWSMFAQGLGGCLVSIPAALVMGESWPKNWLSEPSGTWALLYLAVFSTAIAWFFYFHLVHTWGSVRAASVTYTVPLVAIALDFLAKGHIPNITEWLGMSIIFIGLYWMRKKAKDRATVDTKKVKVKHAA
ncbi:MAG TPA: DMT family transporter [Oligoflexia bacterium]|nr:DMT family transporter [Oligoflexia bacterium]HMR25285.1 DMT family transporter [Oligoflexia bacterium]